MSLENKLKNFYRSNKAYHLYARKLNEEITDERRAAFKFIPNNSLVLDVGCGSAENGRHIARFARYVGLDLSRIALDMALDYKSESLHLVEGDASRLCFKPGSFDAVLSTYSLEHFISPESVLNQIYSVCKKGGIIIIISPVWDLPFQFPPSMNMTGKTYKRLFCALARVFEDLVEYFLRIKHDFKIIRRPSCFTDGYLQDNDTVYLARAREVIAYLKNKGCEIIYRPASGRSGYSRLCAIFRK